MLVFGWVIVFFFKQKTAYEMRISDWSSDVCSSDLFFWAKGRHVIFDRRPCFAICHPQSAARPWLLYGRWVGAEWAQLSLMSCRVSRKGVSRTISMPKMATYRAKSRSCLRSEEHTSELQSLMRISYAVFCLTKK